MMVIKSFQQDMSGPTCVPLWCLVWVVEAHFVSPLFALTFPLYTFYVGWFDDHFMQECGVCA